MKNCTIALEAIIILLFFQRLTNFVGGVCAYSLPGTSITSALTATMVW